MRIKYLSFYMSLVALVFLATGCNGQGTVRLSNATGEVKNVIVFPRDGIGYYDAYDLITNILMTKDGKRLIFYGQKVHYNTLMDSKIRKITTSSMRKYTSIFITGFYLYPGASVNVHYKLYIPNNAPKHIKRKALAMGFKEVKHDLVPEEKGSLYMTINSRNGYVHKNNYILTRSGRSVIQPARIPAHGVIDIYRGKKAKELVHAPPFQNSSHARNNTVRMSFKPIIHTNFVFKSHKGAKVYEIELFTKNRKIQSAIKR